MSQGSAEGQRREATRGYQLGVVQEVLLALLARGAAHAYELRAQLLLALGPLADALKEGQVYVTLGRLENSGLVSSTTVQAPTDRRERRVYELTVPGRTRVLAWLADTDWAKPAPAEFHVKLVAAAASGWADPVDLVDAQRVHLLVSLREAQQIALAETAGSVASLLLEGVVLRIQADLRWLEKCAEFWSVRRGRE